MSISHRFVLFTEHGGLYEAAPSGEIGEIVTDVLGPLEGLSTEEKLRRAISAISDGPPEETKVPKLSAAGAEILYGIAIFVVGAISAGIFSEIGKDIWVQLKRGIGKIAELWRTRHENKPDGPRRPRVEVSLIEEIDNASKIKVQISIADNPEDLVIMFKNSFKSLPKILELAHSEGAHAVSINENCFDINKRVIAINLYMLPPREVSLLDKSQFKSVSLQPDKG